MRHAGCTMLKYGTNPLLQKACASELNGKRSAAITWIPKNTEKYNGYNVLHLRAGYGYKGFEIWLNLMNAADNYYSYITSKSSSGYSYQLAEPRNFNVGVAYDFSNLLKKK